ncbi:MAG TPA: hypothetical protein VJ905_12120 [Halalkalibaculum sp.]|nr:hypothetical protein [Halalkalibaculum sp.]
MRSILLLLITTLIASACASSEKNSNREADIENLVSLNPPGDREQEESTIYIDSVETITYENSRALLISGSFPDACTHLSAASDTLIDGSLHITLEAWRESDRMCAQVLTSYSYIYSDIPVDVLSEISSVTINDRSYPINR